MQISLLRFLLRFRSKVITLERFLLNLPLKGKWGVVRFIIIRTMTAP